MPANGSTVHSFGLAATTSKCDSKSRLGFWPVPLNRVIMLPLPGADSIISVLNPSLARYFAIYVAACVSLPGGLVVFIHIKSLSKLVISCSTSVRIFFALFSRLPDCLKRFFLLKVSVIL